MLELQKSGSISTAPNEPSIKEDEDENGESAASNGDSGIVQSASSPPMADEGKESGQNATPNESEQPRSQEQTEKKEEKYVDISLKALFDSIRNILT